MTSDLFITEGEEKVYVGKVTKVNDDGTVEIETTLEGLVKLCQLRPDLLEKFIQNQTGNKDK